MIYTKRSPIWVLLLCLAAFVCKAQKQDIILPDTHGEIISVEYPEVYELSNIILALTDYGINDKWQVRKDFDYYKEMRAYFKPYEDHPLIDSVNFSRERWQEYLSFRTDAYVFTLDENYELKRVNDFQSFDIKAFDKYQALIEDFAKKSQFKAFFNSHKVYYKQITDGYKREYLLPEMKSFLTKEFGNYSSGKKYAIVISPFAYAQNLHRDIDSAWTADFTPVAKPIIDGTGFSNVEEKSTEIHTLFTEMNHGYVNPITEKSEVEKKFNEQLWDDESGYSGGGEAVFNEYMTWAVFDIFNESYFPDISEKINLNWHFQNDTRGFIYSGLFARKLKELYHKNRGVKRIKDLYPEILNWTNEIQHSLTKPLLLNDSDTITVSTDKNIINLSFSEPMVEAPAFDLVLQFGQWENEVVEINKKNNLTWTGNGTKLSFQVVLPPKKEYYLLLNWWGVAKPLTSKKGVDLMAKSGLLVKGN